MHLSTPHTVRKDTHVSFAEGVEEESEGCGETEAIRERRDGKKQLEGSGRECLTRFKILSIDRYRYRARLRKDE